MLEPAAILVAKFAEAARSDAAPALTELKSGADELLEDSAGIYVRVWRKVERKDAGVSSRYSRQHANSPRISTAGRPKAYSSPMLASCSCIPAGGPALLLL